MRAKKVVLLIGYGTLETFPINPIFDTKVLSQAADELQQPHNFRKVGMLTKLIRTAAISGRSLLITSLLVALLAGRSPAQETASIDGETAKALLQRVKDLESEVTLLKAQMQAL